MKAINKQKQDKELQKRKEEEQEKERELLKQKQKKALQDTYNEMLKNLMSTNIVKPTNVEAQRILNILDILVKDIEILSYIDSDFLVNFMDGAIGKMPKESIEKISPKVLEMMKSQAKIEFKFHDITKPEEEPDVKEKKENEDEDEQNEDEKVEENKIDEEEKRRNEEKKQQEIEQCRDSLSENLKNLLRAIRTNDMDFHIIKHLKPEVKVEMSDIIKFVKSFQIIMLKKLSTAADEEEIRKKQITELNEKIGQLQKSKNLNVEELETLKNVRSKHANDKKQEYDKLKSDIDNVKKAKKERAARLEKESNANIDNLKKDHAIKEANLKTKLLALQQSFAKLHDDNGKEEDELKRKKQNAEGALNEAMMQYDHLMDEFTKELSDLEVEHRKINKELQDLDEHFANVNSERAREIELERQLLEKKKKYDVEQKRRREACRHIVVAIRNMLEKKNKKKKKKPKKKKK